MCRLRQVLNVYTKCGHGISLPDELIRCESRHCRFSLFHPTSCKPPQCRRTCAQFKKFPEQYSPHINSYCPACLDSSTRVRPPL
ncbi:hypothetical protein BDZ89DRAFT_1084774, partial [Hymenopellis radicata]